MWWTGKSNISANLKPLVSTRNLLSQCLSLVAGAAWLGTSKAACSKSVSS